eukprot:5921321-Pleurochrysis_carterae.AAC.1
MRESHAGIELEVQQDATQRAQICTGRCAPPTEIEADRCRLSAPANAFRAFSLPIVSLTPSPALRHSFTVFFDHSFNLSLSRTPAAAVLRSLPRSRFHYPRSASGSCARVYVRVCVRVCVCARAR